MTDKEYEFLGDRIISLLYLTKDKDSDRVSTTYGTKTSIGLAKTIQRLFEEVNK